jgi:hypothetical protein
MKFYENASCGNIALGKIIPTHHENKKILMRKINLDK